MLLEADAQRAGLPPRPVLLTDTPMDRESDFGRVDNHNSAVRAADDARRTHNLVSDYPVDGTELVQGEWSGAKVTASSSAADATQIGGAAPGSSTAAAVDGDPSTAWISNGSEFALGQWIRLDLDKPIANGSLRFTTTAAALGDPVKWVEVRTQRGTVSARITEPGEPVSVALPAGKSDWVMISAARTETGTRGGQFGISELTLDDYSNRDDPGRRCSIETITAAFEMEEVPLQLRDRITGLKTLGDGTQISKASSSSSGTSPEHCRRIDPRCERTCPSWTCMRGRCEAGHRRGESTPSGAWRRSSLIRSRPEATERALAAVRADKAREAELGFDGSWAAHPDLVGVAVPPCSTIGSGAARHPTRRRDEEPSEPSALIDFAVAGGTRTCDGLADNAAVVLEYLAKPWFAGTGAVALVDLMEDVATAEIVVVQPLSRRSRV